MTTPQTRERHRAERRAHVILGLVAALLAAVFGGMSYVSAISPAGVQPLTGLVRTAIPLGAQVASSTAKDGVPTSPFVVR